MEGNDMEPRDRATLPQIGAVLASEEFRSVVAAIALEVVRRHEARKKAKWDREWSVVEAADRVSAAERKAKVAVRAARKALKLERETGDASGGAKAAVQAAKDAVKAKREAMAAYNALLEAYDEAGQEVWTVG